MMQKQHMTPNFMKDVMGTFIHVIHNEGKLKLKILSFILKR